MLKFRSFNKAALMITYWSLSALPSPLSSFLIPLLILLSCSLSSLPPD